MNRYEIKDNYVVGYTTKNEPFYVDIEDYEKVKPYSWYKDAQGYFRTNHYVNKKRTALFLHNCVMNNEPSVTKLITDHIHGSETTNDNRKSNLRLVTQFINNINQPNRKDNTSGVKGVNWSKQHKKWMARISVNCKRIFLGRFDTLEEAKRVRQKAEEEYYGEYSYKNSITR